jgi:large subunit ribosomal protein L30e
VIDVEKAIATAVKTGRVSCGAASTIENAKTGKVKLIILAANCPRELRENIEYYSKLSKTPFFTYKASSADLAAVCGKPFLVSALSIKEAGDSEILALTEEEDETSSDGNE